MNKKAFAVGALLTLGVILVIFIRSMRVAHTGPAAGSPQPELPTVPIISTPTTDADTRSGFSKDKEYRNTTGLKAFTNSKISFQQRMEAANQVHRVEDSADLEALKRVLDDKAEPLAVRNEAMNLLRRTTYRAELYRHLLRLLHDPEERDRFRGYCIQHLGYEAKDTKRLEVRAEIVSELAKLLDDTSPVVRARSLRSLTLLDEAVALEKAAQLVTDGSHPVLIRHTAIHTIGHFKAKEHLPTLRKLAAIGHWQVRRAAIAVLGEFRDEESRAIFKAALKPGAPDHGYLKRAAEVALKKLEPREGDGP